MYYYSNDIKALNDAFITNNLEELVSFSNFAFSEE